MNTRFPLYSQLPSWWDWSPYAACTLGPEPERPTTAADVGESYVYASEGDAAPCPRSRPGGGSSATRPRSSSSSSRWRTTPISGRRRRGSSRPRPPSRRPAAPGCRRSATALSASEAAKLVRASRNRSPRHRFDHLLLQLQRLLAGRSLRSSQADPAVDSGRALLAEEAAREAVVHAVVASVVRARVLVATAAWALDINREITRELGVDHPDRRPPLSGRRRRCGRAPPGAREPGLGAGLRSRYRRPARTGSARPRRPGRSPTREAPRCCRTTCRSCRRSIRFRSVCRRPCSIGGPICGGRRCSSRRPPTVSAPRSPTSILISASPVR